MNDKDLEKSFLYGQSLALLTDLYQLTMVYGYWKAGIADREAVFHLNFRKWPFKGGFAIAAGLETAAQFINKLHFTKSDLLYLKGLKNSDGKPIFEEAFLKFLSHFDFTCDIDALPEGSLVFPYEPILRIKGPIWQAQLLESPILNIINFQTLIATKAARVSIAADPDPVVEFGMRRAQGMDGAISASRAAYVGGAFSTSDVLAGKLFHIPVMGTHAHSWIMAFEEETEAFHAFAKAMPRDCVMLIDTYDSIQGVKNAIDVAKKLSKKGDFNLAGVRLDSGDLAKLSIEVRKILDREGFTMTKIMASNELDEYLIQDLKQQGAKITVWGVGTHLVTGSHQPALDGVYKLSAIQNSQGKLIHKIKLSEQTAKTTNPGVLQIRRYFDGKHYVGDAIFDELIGGGGNLSALNIQDPNLELSIPKESSFQDLLTPIYRKGKICYDFPDLKTVQAHGKKELSRLPASIKRFTNPQPYFIGLEKHLYDKKLELIKKLKAKR